jgi:hypothetical protein
MVELMARVKACPWQARWWLELRLSGIGSGPLLANRKARRTAQSMVHQLLALMSQARE